MFCALVGLRVLRGVPLATFDAWQHSFVKLGSLAVRIQSEEIAGQAALNRDRQKFSRPSVPDGKRELTIILGHCSIAASTVVGKDFRRIRTWV